MATEYKTGDTFPDIAGTVTDASSNPVDISTATSVRFIAKRVGGVEIIAGTAVNDDDGSPANAGKWHYVWQTNDLDVAGSYEVEIEVTWSVGKIETFPDNSARNPQFTVTADLD